MDKPRCHNCKFFTDTFGRWCDGFCSKDKQYTWFFNTCEKHEWKGGQHGFEERDKSAD